MSTQNHTSDFEGRVALVTGAGSGIGAQVAVLLAQRGAIVVATDRRAARVDETLTAMAAPAGSCRSATLDVTDRKQFGVVVEHLIRQHGRLDLLVNNAGVVKPPTMLADYAEADFDHVMAVNAKGVFNGLNATLGTMISRSQGAILNIASVTAVKTVAGLGPYAASKQAVTALTRAAALEAGPYGIRVNELLPGPTLTPMLTGRGTTPLATAGSFADDVPLRRISSPAEQAEAALFLLSDRASYVNGASLLVDGGLAWV